jgi:hypothetical protein
MNPWHHHPLVKFINKQSQLTATYMLVAPAYFEPAPQITEETFDLSTTYNIFSSFPLHDFSAVDSKADSQMLSAMGSSDFIHAQAPETAGLLKMEVFGVK